MIFDGRYKLVTGAEPSPILYDLKEDPLECSNVAHEKPEVVERLRRVLEERATADTKT
jgi:hypothetical protein